MSVRGVIQYKNSPAATAKELRNAVKEANKGAVERWHRDFVPGHFTLDAIRKYRYKPRAGQGVGGSVVQERIGGSSSRKGSLTYTARKRKQFGHTRPLEWTGRSRRIATRFSSANVSGTSKRGTYTFRGLDRYFYAYRKDQNQPDKAEELTRITRKETLALARTHGHEVTDHLNKMNVRETVRV